MPDPVEANRIKSEGEEYVPEKMLGEAAEQEVMTDGGTQMEGSEAMQSNPWQDKQTLQRLYWGEEMSLQDVADELGCSPSTVIRWMEKFDISRRDKAEAIELSGHLYAAREASSANIPSPWVPYGIDERYEYWREPISGKKVYVHQLLAIADGADPYEVFDEETVCHHSTHHPQDNRPGVVEVMSRSEHISYHNRQETLEWKQELIARFERTNSAAEVDW